MNYLQNIRDNNPIKEEMEVETKMKQKIVKKGCKEENRGITLVALVVTIVVLLILAGITITALFSENGIIKKAQEAKNETERDQADTQAGLTNLAGDLNNILNEYGVGGSGNGGEGGTEEIYTKENIGTLVAEGKKYAKYTDDTGTAYIPEGYCIVSGDNNTVANGLVISDKAGDTMANDGKGNQFVWVPVTDITQMAILQEGSTTNYRGVLYDFGTSSSPKDPPQPYSYSPNSGNREPAIVDDSSDGTGTSHDGDTANINPVLEDKYKDTTGTKKIQEQFKAQLQAEFNSMVASVDKYKGFYIGRYETGNLSGTAVVQKGNTDINYQSWYTMYNKSKTLKGGNNNVTTSIIWGCQWDATLRWFLTSTYVEVKKFVTNSTGKGNYLGTNGNIPIATGSNDDYKVNNIYDMAGNVYDWTVEANGTYTRASRGGDYYYSGSGYPASNRGSGSPTNGSGNYGSRSTLLINP